MTFNKRISALLLAIFIDSIGWGVVYPVFTSLIITNSTHLFPITTSTEMRNFWFEFVIAIYCIFMFLSSPVLGSLSDRYGRKIILLISLIGNALGFLISVLGISINSLLIIIAGRVVSGATAGSLTIAQAALMDISEPSQKAIRIGWIGLANGIGFAFGPLLGGLWLDKRLWNASHYQIPFWISAFLALGGAVFINLYFTETFSPSKSSKINILTNLRNIKDAFQVDVRYYCLMMLLFMLSWNIFFNEIPIFLDERFKIYGAMIGYFMAYVSTFFALSLLAFLPRMLKLLSVDKIVLTSLSLQLVFLILFAISYHPLLLWFFVTPLVIAVPFAYVGIVTQASNFTDKNHQGRIMGVISSIVAFAWGLGPILTGSLAKSNFVDPYYASAAALFIAFLIGIVQMRSSKKRS